MPRCIVLLLTGKQCSRQASVFRLCREHYAEQQQLLTRGDSLEFVWPYHHQAEDARRRHAEVTS